MNTLTLVSRTVYPKWIDGEEGGEPGPRPSDPAVWQMMVSTVRSLGCQSDLDDANDDLEYDEETYTDFEDTSADDVFTEAAFRMLVAPECWEYIYYVVDGGGTRYHVIEVHESNPYGAVFAEGDTERVLFFMDDGGFGAETPDLKHLEGPLRAAVWG